MVDGFASKNDMCSPPSGVFVCACCALECHVVAFEADSVMFKAILAPLEDSINDTLSKEQPRHRDVQMDDGEVAMQHVWKQCRLSV